MAGARGGMSKEHKGRCGKCTCHYIKPKETFKRCSFYSGKLCARVAWNCTAPPEGR